MSTFRFPDAMTPHLLPGEPSAWVTRFAPIVPKGEVLDLACGAGRHARHFAARGHHVIALDRDVSALAGLNATGIIPMQFDLEADGMEWPFDANRFAAIVVTNYLHRPLFPLLISSLAPDGVLIYETFAEGNGDFGKPSNPDFLLRPGELLTTIRTDQACPLRVIAFEDGFLPHPKPAMVQRICALKQGSAPIPPENLRLF